MQPVSIFSTSPGPSVRSISVPPAWTRAMPSPVSRCMMNPSPPNSPTPIFFWNAMPICTPRAAQRNESFWQIISPPSWSRCIGMILPGYGAANATLSRRAPRAGGRERRHEQRLARHEPFARAGELAEEAGLLLRRVAEHRLHLDARRHVHHAAGLGDDHLAGVECDLGVLHLLAEDLVVDDVRRRPRALVVDRRRRWGRRAAELRGDAI